MTAFFLAFPFEIIYIYKYTLSCNSVFFFSFFVIWNHTHCTHVLIRFSPPSNLTTTKCVYLLLTCSMPLQVPLSRYPNSELEIDNAKHFSKLGSSHFMDIYFIHSDWTPSGIIILYIFIVVIELFLCADQLARYIAN